MPINPKAQIFSIDFLLASILMVLIIAVLLQFGELNAYNMKEKSLMSELRLIAVSASHQIVSNNNFICQAKTSQGELIVNVYYLNCLDLKKISNINKESLGIPDNFNYSIYSSIPSLSTPLQPNGSQRNVYSIERIIVYSDGPVVKDGIKNLPVTNIFIKVWRS